MNRFLLLALGALLAAQGASAQAPYSPPAPPAATQPLKPATVERIGTNLFKLREIRVDTANREVSVPGSINQGVTSLEFIANTSAGWRAYESALTLDTDAISFNAALLLIGLDGARAKGVPRYHFDRTALDGDVVSIFIECPSGECERMPAERIMYDRAKNEAVSGGRWIYTGSSFLPDGRYRADLDAVLIGFVHDPATVIEYSQGAGLGRYGQIITNPNVGLAPGTRVKLVIKAPSTGASR